VTGQPPDRQQPLGYPVRRLDEALDDHVEKLLWQRHQPRRAHWQPLPTVTFGPP
jgi:hypothetical protein